MPSWPIGKGPIVGQCPYCRSAIRIKWSCKAARETYCTGCGQVNLQKSVAMTLSKKYVQLLVDEVFKSLHKREVRLQPFLRTVHQVSKMRYGVGVRGVSKGDLEKWGYVVSDEWVRKV